MQGPCAGIWIAGLSYSPHTPLTLGSARAP